MVFSGFVTSGSYLAIVVDSRGGSNSPARVGRDQGVEVDHRLSVLFEEGTRATVASVPNPNHLVEVVYVIGVAGRAASDGAQVLPLLGNHIVDRTAPNRLARIVDA